MSHLAIQKSALHGHMPCMVKYDHARLIVVWLNGAWSCPQNSEYVIDHSYRKKYKTWFGPLYESISDQTWNDTVNGDWF